MKQIFNWRKATVADIESDGLLNEATLIHVLSYQMSGKDIKNIHSKDTYKRIEKFFRFHIDNQIPIVMHNGITFDVPLVEKITGIDLSELMLIDTLALSWYLNPDRDMHGLDSFFKDYGIKKPAIDDWENLSIEEYVHRCDTDVKINTALWEDLINRLEELCMLAKEAVDRGDVGGTRMSPDEVIYIDRYIGDSVDNYVNRILTFLCFKMDTARIREETKIKADVPYLQESLQMLEDKLNAAKAELESVMPVVPKYSPRKKPAKPFLKNGELSASGRSWEEIREKLRNDEKDEHGNPMVIPQDNGDVKLLTGYEEPNANSPIQIKDFLFKNGWEPCTFKYEKDKDAMDAWVKTKPKRGAEHWEWDEWKANKPKERKIPQVTIKVDGDKQLAPSVEELAESIPEVKSYADYTLVKHRRDFINSMLENLVDGDRLVASLGGLTNTLREQHRKPICNMPGVDKPYGENIRGALIADDGYVMMGSDLASLEDRTKHHYMLPHDPEYVQTMMEPDYDPHLAIAVTAGMITKQQMDEYKAGNKTPETSAARKRGKSCLPVDNTQVLTRGGWKNYADLYIGQEVLSYNTEKGVNEFCKITDIVHFTNAQTVEIGTTIWKLESTPDHRWYGWKYYQKDGKRFLKKHFFTTTEEMNMQFNILNSANYVGGDRDIPTHYVELVGWILSDGYLSVSKFTGKTSQGLDGRRREVRCSLSQLPRKYLDDIIICLDSCGLSYNLNVIEDSGVVNIKLKSSEMREFMKSSGIPFESKHDADYTPWLLSLNKECLEAFVSAFWKADGWTKGKSESDPIKVMYQNQGSILESVKVACYLLGYGVTVGGFSEGKRSFRYNDRPHLTMQTAYKKPLRKTDVFCLTTENGTFVIKQNDKITITGNCGYSAVYNAQPPTIARAAGVSLAEAKVLFDGYWKLNWSVKAIAEEQCVVTDSRNKKWLVNPINGFCYSLRKESDRFSTLCQGTGSFFFDMWVDNILTLQREKFGKVRLSLLYHDEVAYPCKDNEPVKNNVRYIQQRAIEMVNEEFMLRRELGCDVQFGKSYAAIH